MFTNYKIFLQKFIFKNYKFVQFSKNINPYSELILRHDIDFDVDLAYKMSIIEDELNIKSTYFFLLRSEFYNILEKTNFEKIQSIKDRGHKISIHFDPSIYENIDLGFSFEKNIFEKLFNIHIEIISLHRPSKIFLNNNNLFNDCMHTYQPYFFNDIKYFADSQGLFRFGSPLDSEEFSQNKTIHLLIHPIWWMTKDGTNVEKIEEFINSKNKNLKDEVAKNCIPYREQLNLI